MSPWNKCMTVYSTIIYLINDWISVTHLCSNAVVLNMYQNNVTFSNIEISRKKSLHDKFNHLIFFNLYWKNKKTASTKKVYIDLPLLCCSGLSPGQTRRRSDEPGRTRSMNAGDPRRKSNLEVPRSFPISTEKRKSDATLLSLNVPAKNNIVAPWEGNQ